MQMSIFKIDLLSKVKKHFLKQYSYHRGDKQQKVKALAISTSLFGEVVTSF